MKLKSFATTFILLLISVGLFAQKPITPDVTALHLHLSDYKDFDASTKKLLSTGYTKIDWPIAKSDSWLKNSTYKLTKDSIDFIIEIVHGENKEVFQVNMYQGFSAKKWASLTNDKKMNVANNLFNNVKNMINKEYETTNNGQRKVWGNYKVEDYDVPATFLKGLDDKNMGYFAYWGPFMEHPIELHSYNAQYIKISVCDPKGMTAYYKSTKK